MAYSNTKRSLMIDKRLSRLYEMTSAYAVFGAENLTKESLDKFERDFDWEYHKISVMVRDLRWHVLKVECNNDTCFTKRKYGKKTVCLNALEHCKMRIR